MGKLETTIKLNDQVSKKLQNINASLNRTVNAMNRLNNVGSAKAVRNINRLAEMESRRGTQIERNTQAYRRQNNALSQQISQNNTIMKQMGQWATKLRNIATIYYGIRTAVQAVGGAVKLSDKMTNADARLNLVAGGNKKIKDELEVKTFAAAQRSTTDYLEFTKAVSKMGILAGDKFKNNDSIIRFVELMNKSFQISGAETSERNAAMLQITQAIASNRLQGDEFRSILENAPMVMDALTKSLGVGQDKLKAMAKEGKITADVLIKAMFDAGQKIEDMYKTLPMTWERIWARMKNVGVLAFKPIQEQFKRLFNSEKFQVVINGICNALIVLGNVGGWALKTLFDLVGKVVGLFERFPFLLTMLKGVLAGLTVAFAVFLTAQLVGLGKSIVAWFIARKEAFLYQLALFKMAVAQYGLNAAIAMCPLTWLLYAIIAVVVVIYLAVAAINHFCGTSISATGIIAGAFMYLGACLWNIIAFTWNYWASFVEFFVNVIKNPVYSVKKLFVNLATNLLDCCIAMTKGWDDMATNFVNAMIDAINLVLKGWNWLVDKLGVVGEKIGLGKATLFEHRTSITSDLTNAKASLQSWLGDTPSDYWTAPKMDYKVLGDAWDKGYNWGSKLEFNLGSAIDDLTKVTLNGQKLNADALNGLGDQLGDIGGNTGDTAKNTGDTAKNTASKYENDYSYLRNWAYQKGMGNSIGYNIKIEQNNQNKIGSNMDLNRVVDAVRDAIIEGIYTQAEGV